jgi:ABC-type nitrate/sulfonate/bicarbonate transport system substrate-binding protein
VLRLTNIDVIFLVSILLQATSTTAIAAPVRVTITSHSLSFVVPILAQQKGLYRDEGLEVELIRARSEVTVVALKSGEIDYTASLGTAFRAALLGDSSSKWFLYRPPLPCSNS